MKGLAGRPRFPLSDYIDARAGLPHQLSSSGMGRQLRTTRAAFAARRPVSEAELTEQFADLLGVASERVFLAHGATEANGLVLQHLARAARRDQGRAPRVRCRLPEYPPLLDAAEFAGFRPVPSGAAADLRLRSDPNNPTGRAVEDRANGRVRWILIDETFREFARRPSAARTGARGLWVTGTLTKVYGADEVRVGFTVAPPESVGPFARTVGLLMDRIPAASRSQAGALLRDRARILREVRGIFGGNLRTLQGRVPDVAELGAPVWFDRPGSGITGTELARAAERAGVVVAPGDYFGDPRGVRVCLTQRTFPDDLAAYVRVRDRLLASARPARAPAGGFSAGAEDRGSGRRRRRAAAVRAPSSDG